MSMLHVEIANGPSRECGNDGGCWAVIKSQIDDVFGPKGKSAKRTACERGFASQYNAYRCLGWRDREVVIEDDVDPKVETTFTDNV